MVFAIDRARFLELSLLLASVGCNDKAAPPPSAPAAATTIEPPRTSEVERPEPVTRESVADAGAANDLELLTHESFERTCPQDGTVDACSKISPSCEGFVGDCRGLAFWFVGPVAKATAECWEKKTRGKCRQVGARECLAKAILSACIEPEAERRCGAIMDACKAKGRTPSYSLATCAKVLSSISPEDRSFTMETAIERMGPSTREGCSLEYVLPWYPFQRAIERGP